MNSRDRSERGRFITIEGVEGVGKTTNMGFIKEFLTARQVDYLVTREPGGTALGEKVREILLRDHDEPVSHMTELLLIFAARAQHLESVIKPALQAGRWVLCDRFTDATYAYQGGGRGIDQADIAALEQLVQGGLRPDLTLILDLPPEVGLQRAAGRGALDRFEKEQLTFFERVRHVYLQRASAEPQRCIVINAGQPLDQVRSATLAVMETLYQKL